MSPILDLALRFRTQVLNLMTNRATDDLERHLEPKSLREGILYSSKMMICEHLGHRHFISLTRISFDTYHALDRDVARVVMEEFGALCSVLSASKLVSALGNEMTVRRWLRTPVCDRTLTACLKFGSTAWTSGFSMLSACSWLECP